MGKRRKGHQSSLPKKSDYSFVDVCPSTSKSKSKSKLKSELKSETTNNISHTEKLRKYRMYLMKDALKHQSNIPTYRIPEAKLKNALDILDNSVFDKTKSWQSSCQPQIYEIDGRKREIVTSTFSRLLKEARKCLLKRDWNNLAKIICMAKPLDKNSYEIYLDVFKKYAEICLIHNPYKELLDNFKQGILSSSKNDTHDMLFKKIARRFDDDYDSEKSDDSDRHRIDESGEDDNDINDDDDDDNDDWSDGGDDDANDVDDDNDE